MLGFGEAARAYILVQDTFSYPDGCLTAVSAGLWTAHNEPGNGCVQVTGGRAKVDAWRLEDVSAALPGGPYSVTDTPNLPALYSSYTLQCLRLPTNGAVYFSHFKASGLQFFRDRVFLMTDGAAPGMFRLGIASTNNTVDGVVAFPQDLQTGAVYTVVTRLDLAMGQSMLWVDPKTESDLSVVSAPPDPGWSSPVFAYALRQARHHNGVVLIGDFKVSTLFSDIVGTSAAPLISTIPPQATAMNMTLGPLPFTVQSPQVSADNLTVAVGSSNPGLVPNDTAHLALGGTGTNRFLTLAPVANAQGSATITLALNDSLNTSRSAFLVTVGAPTISAIADQVTYSDTPVLQVPFTVFDPDLDQVALSVSSSNTAVLPPSEILLQGSDSNRTASFYPVPGQYGLSAVSIAATDGFNSNYSVFLFASAPRLGRLLTEDFLYPSGPPYSNRLTAAPNSPWTHSSGTPFQITYGSNAVFLCYSNTESAGAALNGTSFQPSGAASLYAAFTVTFSVLPFTNGSYFFMLKRDPANSLVYRGKVFASTRNAAKGSLRLGVANFEDTPVDFPQDLNLNTTYQVVLRYNVGTGGTRFWINPYDETSASVDAADAPSSVPMQAFGLRCHKRMGCLALGALRGGSSFQDVFVLPTPPVLQGELTGANIVLSWSNSLFGLAFSLSMGSPFVKIQGATSPYTSPVTGSGQFFRCIYP
jgi:hypothetical protein